MTHPDLGWHLRRAAGQRNRSAQEPEEEVTAMKKITVRKTGSIKLTSSAALYCGDCC
jgi:hypothetical protein